VGAAATGVAASRALASRGPDPLITDPFAEPLVKAVGVDSFTRLVSGEISPEDAFNEQRMAEGTAVRTRFFDGFFKDATAAGLRQAVILASGLDSRAYRLPWPTGTVVYEVDQPQVIEFKTNTLSALGATPAAERRAMGIDLRDDWPATLRDNGFNESQPTPGSPKGCWCTSRPTRRTGFSITSRRSAPPAAGWPPSTFPT
jgi:methyltransferase (TIGR00027 family)